MRLLHKTADGISRYTQLHKLNLPALTCSQRPCSISW